MTDVNKKLPDQNKMHACVFPKKERKIVFKYSKKKSPESYVFLSASTQLMDFSLSFRKNLYISLLCVEREHTQRVRLRGEVGISLIMLSLNPLIP